MSDTRRAGFSRILAKIAAAFLLVAATACTKNEVKVRFALDSDVNRAYTLLYYASDPEKGWIVETVASLQHGKGEVTLPTVNPAIFYLSQPGSPVPQAIFYATRGDKISVSGQGDDPAAWKITGNRITDALTEWRLQAAEAIAARRKDPAAAASETNRLVTRYVEAHPSDPVSTLLLLCHYDRRNDEKGFAETRAMLEGDAASGLWTGLVERTDILSEVKIPDEIGKFAVKSAANGVDTIRPGEAPVVLYFARQATPGRSDHVKMLRHMIRERKDSSSLIVVETSCEPDSTSRRMNLRRDSLEGAVRAWMPLGVSDSTARRLGVTRLPYMIAIDSAGRVAYRGEPVENPFN